MIRVDSEFIAWPKSQNQKLVLTMFSKPILTLGLLLASFPLTCVWAQEAKEKPDAPSYYGVMDVGPREFRFSIESITKKDGSNAYVLVSLDEGEQRFPLTNFQLDNERLEFELKTTKAAYQSTSSDGKTYKGKWKQSGAEFDLVFRNREGLSIEQPDETWSGELSTLFQKLKIQFRIYRREGGEDRVMMDSLSQKAGGFKGTRKLDEGAWVIDVPGLKSKFEGKANSANDEITGKWTQGGQAMDLRLTKSVAPATTKVVAPLRPQTPKAPFPYNTEDVVFENTKDQVKLAGTLTTPKQPGPYPAVILISGSGPQDRDESILEHRPFWVIADYLTRQGIAVLRYDDRGTASSTGDFSKATSEDFANDAEAALEFLRKNPSVLPNKIGLVGHSEGGNIAPLVASKTKDVGFIVMLAGPGVNGREVLISQGQLIMRASGVEDAGALETQRLVQKIMIDAAVKLQPGDDLDAVVSAGVKELEAELPADAFQAVKWNDTLKAGIQQMSSPWFRFFITHEPAPPLKLVQCPVLALNGERDVQVDPKVNLPAVRKALEEGGNKNFSIEEVPQLNHLFQTSQTGAVQEYSTIEETVSPVVLKRLTEWIKQVTQD